MATIEHEGYVARIELDEDEKVLHGRVINIGDVVTFEASSAPQLLREFKRSMEDYFAFCKKRGEEPEKPFSGKFVLRVDPAVHRAIAVAADREAKSINKWAEETLARAAERGIIVRAPRQGLTPRPVVKRPGALKRFLDDRDG